MEIFHIQVETAKKYWQNLRDPYRKKELDRVLGGPGTSGASKKSGAAGLTPAEMSAAWAYYEKMSFLKPFLYIKE